MNWSGEFGDLLDLCRGTRLMTFRRLKQNHDGRMEVGAEDESAARQNRNTDPAKPQVGRNFIYNREHNSSRLSII